MCNGMFSKYFHESPTSTYIGNEWLNKTRIVCIHEAQSTYLPTFFIRRKYLTFQIFEFFFSKLKFRIFFVVSFVHDSVSRQIASWARKAQTQTLRRNFAEKAELSAVDQNKYTQGVLAIKLPIDSGSTYLSNFLQNSVELCTNLRFCH